MLRPFPLLGAPAAAGPQAAAERPAHQTRPEDHEVSASAQGNKHVIAALLAKHQRRVCCGVANIQVEKPKHLYTNICAETDRTQCCLVRVRLSRRERGFLF